MSDFDDHLRSHYVATGLQDERGPTYAASACGRAGTCWAEEPEARRPPTSPAERGQAYAPWVGPAYENTRLVVVGENFYEHGGWEEARKLIRWAIPQLANNVRRMNFGVKGYKGSLFQHRAAEYARVWLERQGVAVPIGEVYNHIAFTNHVKCCPRSDARGRSRPNHAMWETCGRHVLAQELEVLGATRVLIVGTSWNAGAFKAHVWPGLRSIRQVGRAELLRDSDGREALVVPHPAAHGGAAWAIVGDVRAVVQ